MPLIPHWSFRFRRLLGVVLGAAAMAPGFSAEETKRGVPTDRPVNYEAFGAVGDGVADDMPAIVEAHAFANTHGLAVKTKPDATYHLGRRALTAIIATDTDWGTSKFIVDDTEVENHRVSLFAVRSLLVSLTEHILNHLDCPMSGFESLEDVWTTRSFRIQSKRGTRANWQFFFQVALIFYRWAVKYHRREYLY